jgi:hypothetical protein
VHQISCIMGKGVFGGDSDPRFSGKGLTDITEFGNVEKAMYNFSMMVNTITSMALASISNG